MAEAMHRMTLAIPASLKPRLDQLAARERRSMNAQIIKLLEGAVASEGPQSPASASDAPAAGERLEA